MHFVLMIVSDPVRPFLNQDLEALKREMKAERDCSNKVTWTAIPGCGM